jgi:hypothetical protein
MKDVWYADNRDLVKWGVLLRLAEQYGAKRVLQVAYYRPTDWSKRSRLKINEHECSIPKEVLGHFRNLRDIQRLTFRDVRIDILDSPFSIRADYLRTVLAALKAADPEPLIMFLDPDTGLQPTKPRLEHVLEEELRVLWHAWRAHDILVFYQHRTNRSGTEWIPAKRRQFERVIGERTGVASGVAHDVVFFFAQKSKSDGERNSVRHSKTAEIEDTQRARLCPACGSKLFKRWPWGWDAHAAFRCPGVSGATPEGRKNSYRQRYLREDSTEDYFRERAQRASITAAKRILKKAGKGKPPLPGDEIQ